MAASVKFVQAEIISTFIVFVEFLYLIVSNNTICYVSIPSYNWKRLVCKCCLLLQQILDSGRLQSHQTNFVIANGPLPIFEPDNPHAYKENI